MVVARAQWEREDFQNRLDSLRTAIRADFGRRAQQLRSLYRDLDAACVPGFEDSARVVERLSVDAVRRRSAPSAWVARALGGIALRERSVEAELLALLSLELCWPVSVGWSCDRAGSFVLRLGRADETWKEVGADSIPLRGRVVLADGDGVVLAPCGSRTVEASVRDSAVSLLSVAVFPAVSTTAPVRDELAERLRKRLSDCFKSEVVVAVGRALEPRN